MKLMNKCGDLNKVQLIYFRKLQYTVGWDILVNIVFIWSGLKINPWISKSDVVSLCTSTYKILQQKWDFLLKCTAMLKSQARSFLLFADWSHLVTFILWASMTENLSKLFFTASLNSKFFFLGNVPDSWKIFVQSLCTCLYFQDTHNLYRQW